MTRELVVGLVAAMGCAAPTAGTSEPLVAPSAPAAAAERTWRALTNPAPFAAGAPLLLTDGTVMIQELDTERWWRLTPDIAGSYADGTWSVLAAMPDGYSPLYSATAVLPDGRVIVEGGEYIAGVFAFSTRGAIYDPVTDGWHEVAPPPGWTSIGDASGIVLPNGTFMLSDALTQQMALLDARAMVWTPTGNGKADVNDEESWAMMPDGSVLTIDTNNHLERSQAELYIPSTGRWMSAGVTPIQISDFNPDEPDPALQGSHEIGPIVLRADGTALALGGNGHNVIYDSATVSWRFAPDLPLLPEGQLDVADGPAALLPNGDVLIGASWGVFHPPTHFLEFDGAAFTEVSQPPHAIVNTSYQHFMVLLPTGEVLMTDFSNDIELYTPAAGVVPTAVPVITHVPEPITTARTVDTGLTTQAAELTGGDVVGELPVTTLTPGGSYKLTGRQLNGISQGAYYGDDQQSPTNYPIVRLTYADTGHVTYCRTHDHSSSGIAPRASGFTHVDVPVDAERGVATLVTIANGIASPPILVNVK